MEFLSISDSPRLDTLPDDILLIIISYLSTARSVSRLGLTSRRLSHLVSDAGWRVFVRNRFYTLDIPPAISSPTSTTTTGDDWKQLAKRLVDQSCDWDRRAFVFHYFGRRDDDQYPGAFPARYHRNHAHPHVGSLPPRRRLQTVPCHIRVDAHSQIWSRTEIETVVWGAGEDLVALNRFHRDNEIKKQEWHQHRGVDAGFLAGKEDITSLSLLRAPHNPREEFVPAAIVGRASGDLRLLSTKRDTFGRTIRRFRPAANDGNAPEQKEIQALDTHEQTNLLAATTKDRVLLYPIDGGGGENASLDGSESGMGSAETTEEAASVEPCATLSLRDVPASPGFKFIRSLKFVNKETIALGLTSTAEPLRYLKLTPTGIEALPAPHNIAPLPSSPSGESPLETVRALLPIDMRSVTGGGRSSTTILTSWDDGTIRLQDLRTPSPFDAVYQDHFEPTTPVDSLASYGLERFVAGSGRVPVLKIFDFRMSSRRQGRGPGTGTGSGTGSRCGLGYDYTEALACSSQAPAPQPRPPAVTAAKPLAAHRPRCDHVRGRPCRWHALSRESYYRPNANLYLPLPARSGSGSASGPRLDGPVHSLARGSDASPTLWAGLSGTLVEMSLRTSSSDDARREPPNAHPLYQRSPAAVNLLETGDGTALPDVGRSQRMPILRSQARWRRVPPGLALAAKRHRLDEWLQEPTDYHNGENVFV